MNKSQECLDIVLNTVPGIIERKKKVISSLEKYLEQMKTEIKELEDKKDITKKVLEIFEDDEDFQEEFIEQFLSSQDFFEHVFLYSGWDDNDKTNMHKYFDLKGFFSNLENLLEACTEW